VIVINPMHDAPYPDDNCAIDVESLILVDEADRRVGHMDKEKCRRDRGTLHRAFSLLIFNGAGDLLLQQRAPGKSLWPMFWSNSCCSQPRRSETMEAAIRCRLREELGVHCSMHFLFKFRYQAQFDQDHAEHELCSVFKRTRQTVALIPVSAVKRPRQKPAARGAAGNRT
jgi:isopentenyl-diphosphate delta-isomerase